MRTRVAHRCIVYVRLCFTSLFNVSVLTSPTAYAQIQVKRQSADITVSKDRVKKGDTVSVSWDAEGVTSCTVTQNGNQIASNNAPANNQWISPPRASQPVNVQTVFKITCPEVGNSKTLTATQVVNVSQWQIGEF